MAGAGDQHSARLSKICLWSGGGQRQKAEAGDVGMKRRLGMNLAQCSPWWNDSRRPHQKTSTLDDAIARNGT